VKTLAQQLAQLFKWIIFFCCIFSSTANASGHFGVTIPVVLVGKDPDDVHAYRAVVSYAPDKLNWDKFNLYFAATAGHWWQNSYPLNTTINIYAVAPIFRFYMNKSPFFSSYLEASVGPAYMNQTRFGHRNLGIHYTFQDEITLGGLFGRDKGAFIALSALHYSNGRLSSHNSGITMPVMLNLGYLFG
jgi:hypothetical protein